MMESVNLFRAWNDVGTDGLSEIERLARAEYRDGDPMLLRPAVATRSVREPTILRRIASALRLVRAPGRAPAATGIHPGIAAVHFAEVREAHAEPHLHAEPETVVLVTDAEECAQLHVGCNES